MLAYNSAVREAADMPFVTEKVDYLAGYRGEKGDY